MVSSPRQDDRDAYLFADVASAHDAGLSADEILAGPSTASRHATAPAGRPLSAGLRAKGAELAPHEVLILESAEHSGNLGAALRNLAEQRTDRARRMREVRRRLAYPLFLLVFGFLVSLLATFATRGSYWVPAILVASFALAVVLALRYTRRAAANPGRGRFSLVGDVLGNVGELPYLQSMHGLYAAGVKLIEAHETATKTSAIEGVRRPLREAGERMVAGATYSEALQEARALHPETRQMLATAEAAGELESALGRATRRRQESLDLQSRRLLTVVVAVVTTVVVAYLAFVIVGFWLNYYANLSRLLR